MVKKAVFPVAGFGTRFLPATKAMPKELLPIVDKPLIQYAAEEAVQAGIDTLIFITGRNKRAVEDHFDNNQELEMALRSKGKNKQADMVRNILPEGIECLFVRQPAPLGLGHAVLCAKRAVGNDPFAVLLADDFIVSEEKGVTSDLVSAFEKNSKIQLSVMEIFGSEISNYGVVQYNPINGKVEGLVEKPEENLAPWQRRDNIQAKTLQTSAGLPGGPGWGGGADAPRLTSRQVGSWSSVGREEEIGAHA